MYRSCVNKTLTGQKKHMKNHLKEIIQAKRTRKYPKAKEIKTQKNRKQFKAIKYKPWQKSITKQKSSSKQHGKCNKAAKLS